MFLLHYHLPSTTLLASVWVPAPCESGGLVGMVNTILERNARQDQVARVSRATVAGAMADDRATALKSTCPWKAPGAVSGGVGRFVH